MESYGAVGFVVDAVFACCFGLLGAKLGLFSSVPPAIQGLKLFLRGGEVLLCIGGGKGLFGSPVQEIHPGVVAALRAPGCVFPSAQGLKLLLCVDEIPLGLGVGEGLFRALVGGFLRCVVVALIDIRDHPPQLPCQLLIREAQGFGIVRVPVEWLRLILQLLLPGHMQRRHQLAHIRPGVLRGNVQHALAVLVRALPVPVLQEQGNAAQQGLRGGGGGLGGGGDRGDRGGGGGLLLRAHHLPDAAHQILHKADAAHVIALQHRQLVGHVVGIHVPVAGDQQTAAVVLHQRVEAAPLVAHPHGVQVLGLRSHHHHHPRRLQGGEDVGLIRHAGLVLQRDAREKHPQAVVGQLVVDILRQLAVTGALAVGAHLLVAEEDVEGLRAPADGEDPPEDLVDLLRALLIHGAGSVIGVGQGGEGIDILQEAVVAGAVAGRQVRAGGVVLHILNAEAAQRAAPVGLGVALVLADDALKHRQRLVELADAPEVIAPVEGGHMVLVRHAGQGDLAAAETAYPQGFPCGQLILSAAVCAFQYGHGHPPFTSFVLMALSYHICHRMTRPGRSVSPHPFTGTARPLVLSAASSSTPSASTCLPLMNTRRMPKGFS